MNSYYNSYATLAGGYVAIIVFALIVAIGIEIAMTVAAVKIANKKGREGSVWGLLTFFFGLVPFIIILCLDPAKPNNVYTTTTDAWACHNCGSINNNGSFCSVCGSARQVAPQYYQQPQAWICPHCGYTNNPNATKCINCYNDRH